MLKYLEKYERCEKMLRTKSRTVSRGTRCAFIYLTLRRDNDIVQLLSETLFPTIDIFLDISTLKASG